MKKKVKTVDAKDDGNEHEEGEELDLDKNEEAELYKHIKEAKESSTYRYIHLKNKIKSVQEQAKTQKYEVPNPEDEETGENPTESSANLPAEEEEMVDSADVNVQKSKKKTVSKKTKTDKKQHP